MFLLKSSKLFVINLSTVFILGILIYHIQLYESSKLLVLAIFGPKLAAIIDFEPLGDQETIYE